MTAAAFVLGLLALITSVFALGWQIASWLMSGAFVRVVLRHGMVGDGGFATNMVKRDHKPVDLSAMTAQGFAGPEVIAITATNQGRSRARIVEFGVTLHEGGTSLQLTSNAYSPAVPCWLEPEDSATWYVPVEEGKALVYATRGVRPGAHGLHGYVTLAAGKRISSRHYLEVDVPK